LRKTYNHAAVGPVVIAVSAASPLISLAAAGHLGFLKHLYEQVRIPAVVYQELTGSDLELPGAAAVQTLEWSVSQSVRRQVLG
jgi:predicted nucleic acid-binding protein